MINTIISLLKANKDVTAYNVIKTKKSSVELFFVTDKLETNRVTDIVSYDVTVYHDFDEFRGSSSFQVVDSFTKDDITNAITKAVARAKFVKNKFYEIPDKSNEKIEVCDSPLNNLCFKDVACKCADAVFKADVYKDGWINSCEIFVTSTQIEVVNSKGVDLTDTQAKIFIELIPTWKGEEEVELYESISSSSVDYDALTAKVNETMQNAKARATAVNLPKGLNKCNVIFTTQESSMFFRHYVRELDYSSKYMHMNMFNIGDEVSNPNTADPVTITMVPSIESGDRNFAFDNSGVVLKPVTIIENSVCKAHHGSYRFGYYLDEKNPTGSYNNFLVSQGSMTFDEMKKEPHILCVAFSGLQVDGHSGYYGGEVRLGFYFDGKNYTTVTGFSISGNLNVDKNLFRFSKELDTYNGYRGPKYILAKDVTIN